MGMLWLGSCTSSSQVFWTELYNGKDMDRWEIRDGSAEVWIEEGHLVTQQADSLHFAYLKYEEEFSDFILECEVKLTGPLNSGILTRGISDPAINNGRLHSFQIYRIGPESEAGILRIKNVRIITENPGRYSKTIHFRPSPGTVMYHEDQIL